MKLLLVTLATVLAVQGAMANSGIQTVLATPTVEAITTNEMDTGYHLYSAVNLYAKTGEFPRCRCERVEIIYRRVVKVAGEGDRALTPVIDDHTYIVNLHVPTGRIGVE